MDARLHWATVPENLSLRQLDLDCRLCGGYHKRPRRLCISADFLGDDSMVAMAKHYPEMCKDQRKKRFDFGKSIRYNEIRLASTQQ